MMAQLVGKNGFSLVEVMITAVILLIVIGSLLLTFVQCIILNENNEDVTVATNDAQVILERLRAEAYSDISSECTNINAASTTTFNTLLGETVTCTVVASGLNYKEININIAWDRRGGQRDVDLSSTFSTAQ